MLGLVREGEGIAAGVLESLGVNLENLRQATQSAMRDPDVLAHLEAENAHTAAVLAGDEALRDAIFSEIKGRVQETDLSVPTRQGGWWYYSRTIEGAQYPVHCRLAAGDETDPPDPDDASVLEAEQILLDQNVEAATRSDLE